MTIFKKGNDSFPEFHLPDVTYSDVSEGEEDSVAKAKYATKEDQDVAVFMAIAERLSISSLLHLLQGHAQSQMMMDSAQYGQALGQAKKLEQEKLEKLKTATTPKKVIKKFRFAEVRDNDVRCVIHEIDSIKDLDDLWWTDEEMMDIRRQAIETVTHFRKYRKRYISAVETVATADTTAEKQKIEMGIKQLSKDNFARGLEAHIVSLLSKTRTDAVHAVLDEQRECRMCQDDYTLTSESLRGQSLAYSGMCRNFARQMGDLDHIEALKAVLGKWTQQQTQQQTNNMA